MNIKAVIKAIIPKRIVKFIHKKRYDKQSRYYLKYDLERFRKYSGSLYKNDCYEKLIAQIIAEYHIIEKGLCMPNMRLGFGYNVIIDLINHCNLFAANYDINNDQYIHALKTIYEYKIEHENNNFLIDDKILNKINNILLRNKVNEASKQQETTKEEYFKYTNSTFDQFSNSRHSIRNFKGEIKISKIYKAIDIAQNAPSACNRQSTRVNVVEDKNLINNILNIQRGNRGFGHLVDKLIIITGELGGFTGINERNEVYVNGGIFAMNLLYSLHFYQIGACTLTWSSTITQDKEIRKLCAIPNSETIILLIACGNVPDSLKVVTSRRFSSQKITRILKANTKELYND